MQNRTGFVIVLTLCIVVAACKHSPQTVAVAPAPTPVPSATPAPFKPISSYPPVVYGKPYPGKGVIKLINRKENWIEISPRSGQKHKAWGASPRSAHRLFAPAREAADSIKPGAPAPGQRVDYLPKPAKRPTARQPADLISIH
jgi:hypothetical protein